LLIKVEWEREEDSPDYELAEKTDPLGTANRFEHPMIVPSQRMYLFELSLYLF